MFNGEIMAIAGLIFGIISVVAFFGLPGVITSAIGLFLTYRAKNDASSNQRIVKIAFILNGIFLVIGFLSQFVFNSGQNGG